MTVTSAGQRIRRMRTWRAIVIGAVVLNAFTFALNVATGSLLVLLPATLIAALLVLVVMQTRLIRSMRRTRELNRHAGRSPQTTARVPARERVLRRVTGRPRRTMTPADYRRLRELEAELGWEPPEPLPAAGVAALGPREPAACDCGEDGAVVQARIPGSTAPAASYCRECGRAERRAKRAARAVSAPSCAPARTDREPAEARAAIHFEALANVGLEYCVSYCPMCAGRLSAELIRAATEAVEPGTVTLLTVDGEPVAGIAPARRIVQDDPGTVVADSGELEAGHGDTPRP